jgi:hypothetical protein
MEPPVIFTARDAQNAEAIRNEHERQGLTRRVEAKLRASPQTPPTLTSTTDAGRLATSIIAQCCGALPTWARALER